MTVPEVSPTMARRSRFLAPVLALSAALTVVLSPTVNASAAPVLIPIPNAGFEQGTTGWAASSSTRVGLTTGYNSANALRVSGWPYSVSGRPSTRSTPTIVRGTQLLSDTAPAGSTYSWTVRMKSSWTDMSGRLTVREVLNGQLLQAPGTTVKLLRNQWTRVEVLLTKKDAASAFEVRLESPAQGTWDVLSFDDVTGTQLTTPPSPPPPGPVLSNGCAYSKRGIPACGAYLGSAYGSNTDPVTMENETGRRLGIHRLYYTAAQVDSAVREAGEDVAAGRVPWISFKLPYSWEDMVAGKGDAWALALAKRMGALPGPVWLGFHHEPETDGDMQAWRKMQERLAPIVRGAAENVAFTVIMTGWHQFYGDAQYSLANIWPRVKVDVAAFDIYEKYGVVKDGKVTTKWTNLRTSYFDKISAWAKTVDVNWAIAETGFTNTASEVAPHWVRNTYDDLKATGGIAFTYFNTTLNSVAPWDLGTQVKKGSYREAAVGSPLLPIP